MKKLNILSLVVLFSLVGCAHRVKILDANAVSMTKYSLKKRQKTKEMKEVEGKFCPDSFKQSGRIGLIDEAVKVAQKDSGADFLTHAVFYREGNCVVATGTAVKIIR